MMASFTRGSSKTNYSGLLLFEASVSAIGNVHHEFDESVVSGASHESGVAVPRDVRLVTHNVIGKWTESDPSPAR